MSVKILIADDNEEILDSVSRVLEGYTVFTAKDGKAAIDLALSKKPDIILLDVSMPGMTGLEVLKLVMAQSAKPIVIMITADETMDTVTSATATGVFSYITKPFDVREILEQVKKAEAFLLQSR